jgi:hypothetical protein
MTTESRPHLSACCTPPAGLLGLYRGFLPTLLREVLGNAAMFGVYDVVKVG